MTRRIIVALLKFALRIYFRRIEVVGQDNVPHDSPVIFVLNHPNGLVDPAFLLCLAPRRVSFLAKAPLFRMPVLSFFVRAMDSLPVYRRQDEGEDLSRNQETFTAARRLLARGGTIGICPEGVSHNEPRLKPIKTGTARIALGAVSTGEVTEVRIVPTGLYYTAKTTFRSGALLYFGKPILASPVDLDANGNPPPLAVRELSSRIEQALRDVILHAEHEEALHTISQAERIFSSGDAASRDNLAGELQLLQAFIKAYAVLREGKPDRIHRLEVRMNRFEEELKMMGMETDDLSPPSSILNVFRHLLTRTLLFLLLIGPALLGTLIHYPAYRLGGCLATRFSQNSEDVVSTIKIISAMLLFPLTWLVLGGMSYLFGAWGLTLTALLALPASGYLAVRFFEELDAFVGGLRALLFFLIRRRFFIRLLAERNAIRHEIITLGNEAAIATRG